MAERARPKAAPEPVLQSEANERRKAARATKAARELDFRECYFFAAPDRMRQLGSSSTKVPQATMGDAPELNTDLGFLLVDDAITEIVNTYLAESQQWCRRRAGESVSEEEFEKVAEEVSAADKKIFGAIIASNFYAELPKAFSPDLFIGGAGMVIKRPHPAAPIEVLAVPMREIDINLGPNGEIDDRFITRNTRNSYVQKLIGEEAWGKVDAKTKKEIEDAPAKTTEVCWGYWRKWDDITDEVWQHVVMIGEALVHDVELRGEGCCEFIFMRFMPDADWAWATGPLLKGLPSLRQIDELERQKITAVERAVSPAITFPDDSFAAVEQGIEPDMAYPIRPGTEGAVKRIYDQPSIEPEVFQTEQMEHRLRKIFYVDHPEQTGDTPPTLGQWLDELARMQRRIGTAGYSFWREGPMRIFIRFKYLMEMAGSIKAVKDKSGRVISTQPYNPAQRAAEQQEIATAFQCAQALAQMFPEEWRVWIDGKASMDAIISKMRTSGLLKMRKEQEVKAALERIQSVMGNAGLRQKAGAPVPEEAGAPAAVAA